ncbi:MAG: hypothetical protein GW936_08725 [Gallionella sp.]|nr:hypothetical protein [Gallionella sp.]
MKVYFDTEFTTLNSMECPALISIGLVASDGREFYREMADGWTDQQCSDFVREAVLPLLNGGESLKPEAEIARELKVWIEAFGEEVVFVTDAPGFDWPLLTEMFSYNQVEWPTNASVQYESVKFETGSEATAYRSALYDYFRNDPRQHHALVDARAMHYALNTLADNEKNVFNWSNADETSHLE